MRIRSGRSRARPVRRLQADRGRPGPGQLSVQPGPVGSVDKIRLQRVVNVMQQFIGFPKFNIDTMIMPHA